MEYMLSFVRDDENWEVLPDAVKDERRNAVAAWIMEQAAAGRIHGGSELRGGDTATTVRFKNGKPVVMDGPFMESREVLGGFVLLDVDDLDEAINVARGFPLDDHAVEIRPTVPR